jgi:hypothetical protein
MTTDRQLQRVLLRERKRDRIDIQGMAATVGVLAACALAFLVTWLYRAAEAGASAQ